MAYERYHYERILVFSNDVYLMIVLSQYKDDFQLMILLWMNASYAQFEQHKMCTSQCLHVICAYVEDDDDDESPTCIACANVP